MGIERKYPYTFHITLCYVEKKPVDDADIGKLVDCIMYCNKKFEEGILFEVSLIEFCEFDNMSDFRFNPGDPYLNLS
jgi:hypothetical protein